MRVLFLAPHGDEAHIGAGGTMARFRNEPQAEVFIMAFSNADASLPAGYAPGTVFKELEAAARESRVPQGNLILHDLGVRNLPAHRQEILEILVAWRKAHDPVAVFVPSPSDIHQDHAVVGLEAVRAFRRTASIYGYDLPWNAVNAPPLSLYVELTEDELAAKARALEHFKSQQGKKNTCATPLFARSLAVVRGNAIDVPYAEAFEVLREVRRAGRGLFQ